MEPLKPGQLATYQRQRLPGHVIKIWNDLIMDNWDGTSSKILVYEAKKMLSKLDGFNISWLSIEELYKANGWKVEYIKPDFTENFEAYWIFRSKK